MIYRILFSLSLIAVLLAGCAAAAPTPIAGRTANQSLAGADQAAPGEAALPESPASLQSQTGDTANRLVIKNADLAIIVDDPSAAMDHVIKMAEQMNGYVVSANLYQDYTNNGVQVPHASVTVRVPAERLDEALATIEAESKQLPVHKNINSQDVTKDYTDQQSRLRNLEATEAQLTNIMDSATKTQDVLDVYNQLTQVREQIEVTKGQIQYYEQSAALSAISVDLTANAAVQPLSIGGWQPVGVAKRAVQALISTVQFLVSAAIWIILYVIPVLALIFVPLFLIVRWLLRLRARRKARTQLSTPAA
jgi:hypothetical protein